VFGRLTKIWRDNGLSIHTKIRSYEALALSTLLYGAETRSMSVINKKKLEAAHHRCQRKILKINWNKVHVVCERTGQDTLESSKRMSTQMVWSRISNGFQQNSTPSIRLDPSGL